VENSSFLHLQVVVRRHQGVVHSSPRRRTDATSQIIDGIVHEYFMQDLRLGADQKFSDMNNIIHTDKGGYRSLFRMVTAPILKKSIFALHCQCFYLNTEIVKKQLTPAV